MKPGSTTLITPRLQVLSEDQKETLFLSALEILEHTGVRVDNDEGLELLSGAGARVGPQRRVRLPSYLVKEALENAPHRITLYNRQGERVMHLESSRVYFCSQVDGFYLFDPEDRTRRACVRDDARLGAILCDALPNIDMVSFSALFSDTPAEIAYLLGHKDTVMNCTKPVMHGTLDLLTLQDLAEMAALVAGGWEELARRPYYVHYVEPLSPLALPDETVAKLLFCAGRGIPLICGPVTLGGATAPVTGAGNLASCLAESLSGLVLAQLKRRGAPVIIGGVPTVMDMSGMTMSYGAPELSLWSAALTEMAHYLRLPVMGTAGASDAVKFDEQAAAESAISCLMAALSGANLVHDVGFIEVAMAASLELIAATDEFISLIRTIMAGLPVTPETLALGTIDSVGPGGSYLQEKHTVQNFRGNWFPTLMNRRSYEQWAAAGGQSLADRTNERVRQILREHQPEPLPPEVVAELDKMEETWWQKVS